ncbi:DNA cytosine methyltransferase [Aminobacter sp. J44]|uniref:DNA cytosine methyltransferase n=1 Tax=Aminobacter sp. J44 TaxID=935262 RepID=UPI00119C2121|nr:DNA (cytosine-5-)-methyltransferase [Aminobacter sp. J44]TWG49858.1 DNA-cytosine methyltransferase [Aminobacter sp. J44]TWG55034.1 DNA-cytosine methyltransferase [Aminobacter sp. J44]
MTTTGNTALAEPAGGPPPLRTLSFCTGMAGDKAAFQLAGIACEMVAVAEINPLASAVLAQKFPNVPDLGDITNPAIDWSFYHGKIDILTAGLPCQPHSIAGKRKGTGDIRDLTDPFCDIVEKVQPEWILVENVEGYRSSEGGKAWRTLHRRLRAGGYIVAHRVIDAADFVPQRRKRLWILAHRGSAGVSPEALLAHAAAGAAGSGVIESERQEAVADPAGGTSVLYPPRLGTLVASGSGLCKPGMTGADLHFLVVQVDPEAGLIVRRPTPLEAIRAQGFPDDWLDGITFKGKALSYPRICQLVGNAWPVPVAAAILTEVQKARTQTQTQEMAAAA